MAIEDIVGPIELNKAAKETGDISASEVPMHGVDFVKFTKLLIEDKSIPEKWKTKFWAFGDKENAIANIEKEDVNTLMNMFEIAKLTYLMSMPDYDYKWDDSFDMDNFKAKYFLKVKRSVGAMERRLLATQIRQIITESKDNVQSKGIMSRIFGLGGK